MTENQTEQADAQPVGAADAASAEPVDATPVDELADQAPAADQGQPVQVGQELSGGAVVDTEPVPADSTPEERASALDSRDDVSDEELLAAISDLKTQRFQSAADPDEQDRLASVIDSLAQRLGSNK